LKNPLEREKRKMKVGRTILVISLILSFLVSMAPISFALPAMATQQQKVQLLDELRIFTGSNGDYRLNDKLSRSEAAALAVRIMGKDYEVLLNASKYKNTPYPDVDPNHWYAPYVGFCTQEGILSGDTKGNYNPNDYVTEKSFLKIVLGVLGYQLNSDYTWDNVYRKAFEVGLVTSLSYIAKEEDNTDFKRGDAVNILYNALMLKEKSTDKELFYRLIDSKVITTEKAIELGLIEKTDDQDEDDDEEDIIQDETPTEIVEVKVFDGTNVSVHFNEDIKNIGEINITESSNSGRELGYQIDTIGKNYVFLITDKQTPGVEYIIEITDIEDEDGNIIDLLYETFTGYTPSIIESNYFRIKQIKPVNEKSVLIYFTHPLNLNVENPLFYKLFDGNYKFADGERDQIIARIYHSEENCVLLSLKNNMFSEGEEYIVEIDGRMTSAYGVRLNDNKGDRMGFIAKSGKQERFMLDQIIPYDESTLMLVFNKEINPFLAQQIYNFYVTDKDGNPITIEKTSMESSFTSGEVLFINLKERLKKNDLYYLTINNLNDITRQEYITEMTFSFEADYGDKEKLEIVDVDSINNQTIEVYFSSALDQTTATDISFYTVKRSNSRIYPQAVYYDPKDDPYRVVLYFSTNDKFVGNKEYILQIGKKFKDSMGNITTSIIEEKFIASSKNKRNPSIEEVTPISSDAIKVTFSDAIAFEQNNLSPNNYSLEYNYQGMAIKEIPISVLYFNSKTLILKFNELEYDLPYTLKFNTIVDFTGSTYKVTGDGTNYVEFELEED